MALRSFTCGLCGHEYDTDTTIDERDTEFNRDFKTPDPNNEYVSLCDWCHERLMDKLKERHGHGPPYA